MTDQPDQHDPPIHSDPIIRMANQIALFFGHRAEEEAIAGTEDHIVRFWDPRMRRDLLSRLGAGGEGLSPIARGAAERLGRRAPRPG